MMDAFFAFSIALFTPIFSILFVAFLMPAVSTKQTIFPPIVMVSSIISLVVPGMLETIAFSSFIKAFRTVDFPTLVFPEMTTSIPFFKTLLAS